MVPRTVDESALPISDRFLARGTNVQLARSLCELPWIVGANRPPVDETEARSSSERPGDERLGS
jgi:hypothetical protein